ncbi:conserved hypothetical protein [Ricinus communis]|uniref:Uncharacterized protein n=1 Tax=Ricinus communis TaxID=3988 RepID=B9RP43_RICCO|nr:conserved hypothetical protein [Ricinus communis]
MNSDSLLNSNWKQIPHYSWTGIIKATIRATVTLKMGKKEEEEEEEEEKRRERASPKQNETGERE